MSDSSYLKTASIQTVADAVRQYGIAAFLGGGLSEVDIAKIAANTISNLDRQNLELLSFFSTTMDDSHESITWDVHDFQSFGAAYARIKRTIKYKPLTEDYHREDNVVYGPLMQKTKAIVVCIILNER